MMTMQEFFRGKKTYIVGTMSVLIGMLRMFESDPNWGYLFLVLGAGLVTMRSAINNA